MVYTSHSGLIKFGDNEDASLFGIRFINASDWRGRHDYKDLRNKRAGLELTGIIFISRRPKPEAVIYKMRKD